MPKFLALILVGLSITACQTTGATWQAINNVDEFTDVQTKMVTVGELPGNKYLFTKSLSYYPFVGLQGETLFVGIRSGGSIRVPTGTVQIRIDDNPAWTISPEETPVSLSPALPNIQIQTMPQFANLQKQIGANMAKVMSPYTAATGDKAKKIILQMLGGKGIKYRIVGANQAASTTGHVLIDASFPKALKATGINVEVF